MKTTPNIKGIRVSNVEVTYKGKPDPDTYYWGAVTVRNGNREFIWDVEQSYTDDLGNLGLLGDGYYRATLDIEPALEAFPDCKFDLTCEDLLDPDSATLYCEGVEPISIQLWFTTLEGFRFVNLIHQT